ncbi:hypothetical protein KI387_034102, partial [Taxus chinensis]
MRGFQRGFARTCHSREPVSREETRKPFFCRVVKLKVFARMPFAAKDVRANPSVHILEALRRKSFSSAPPPSREVCATEPKSPPHQRAHQRRRPAMTSP